mmetsp:Transcript_82896/g.101604  ORF Transcript_82896/g.101604 Transcript_82896/m.101604 type:complete len:464 (+) Transcript_82896:33-1424(+)
MMSKAATNFPRISQKNSRIISREEFEQHNTKDSCWIQIYDQVFDVTEWMRKHPGGERVILCLGGRDATWNFIGNHHPEIARKYLKTFYIGDLEANTNIDKNIDKRNKSIINDYVGLLNKFEKEGWFDTRASYYIWKCTLVLILLFCALYAYYLSNKYNSVFIGILASMTMGIMWQQAAFIGHDLGHNAVFQSVFANRIFGLFEADILQGISSSWWKYTHNVHHIRTNDLSFDPDIQHMPFLAITIEYFNNVYSKFHRKVLEYDAFAKILVKYQHIHYVPIIMCGRVFLYIQSFIYVFLNQNHFGDGKRTRFHIRSDQICLILFWCWMPALFQSTLRPFLYFFIAHFTAGILHIQIIANHFPCPVYTDIIDDNFVTHQFKTSMAISSNWLTDWFHGGLQYQVEHHLFPMMPRHNLKYVKPYLMEFCEKHKIEYLEDSLFGCVRQIYHILKRTAEGGKVIPLEFY